MNEGKDDTKASSQAWRKKPRQFAPKSKLGCKTYQSKAMSFFEHICVNNLNEYYPNELWRKTLMLFSQTVPAVRHAAVALALLHRRYHDGDSILPGHYPLSHYNNAIQLVLGQRSVDSVEAMMTTLLVCYLFTCFDNLAGNYQQATIHLRGGLELSRSTPKDFLRKSNDLNKNIVPSSHVLLAETVKQLRRLDMHASAYMVDWSTVDIQESAEEVTLFWKGMFESVDQAADCLQTLVSQTMELQWMAQGVKFADGAPPEASKEYVIGKLETWSRCFEEMLTRTNQYGKDIKNCRLISLLRLQSKVLWILACGLGPGREMEYDSFLIEFLQCVALADDVSAGHHTYAGSSKLAFTPDIAIIPILYIIGAKCRDPTVRRQVLRILRRQPLREAVWDSAFAAKALERIVEIEESNRIGPRATSMMEIE
ncbi:hypothetical protein ACLX1H_000636 [Fusarium chlamydosporum]